MVDFHRPGHIWAWYKCVHGSQLFEFLMGWSVANTNVRIFGTDAITLSGQ